MFELTEGWHSLHVYDLESCSLLHLEFSYLPGSILHGCPWEGPNPVPACKGPGCCPCHMVPDPASLVKPDNPHAFLMILLFWSNNYRTLLQTNNFKEKETERPPFEMQSLALALHTVGWSVVLIIT